MKHLSFSPIPQRSARVLSSSQRSHFDFLPFSTIFISSESSNPWQNFNHDSWQQFKLFQYLPRWATIDPLLDSGKVSLELIFGWFTFRTNDPIKFWRFLDAFLWDFCAKSLFVCFNEKLRLGIISEFPNHFTQLNCKNTERFSVKIPSLFLVFVIIFILTKSIDRISAMTRIILEIFWVVLHWSSSISSISKFYHSPSQLPHS